MPKKKKPKQTPRSNIRPEVVDEIVRGTIEGKIISSAVDVTASELKAATRRVKSIAKKVDTSTLVACAWATYAKAIEAMEYGTAAKLLTIMHSLVSSSTSMGFDIRLGSLEEIAHTREELSRAVTERRVNGYDATMIATLLSKQEAELKGLIVDTGPTERIESEHDAEERIARILAGICGAVH